MQLLLLVIIVGGLLFSQPALAVVFTVNGSMVSVETDRYRVSFEGLCLTRLENRLTGEIYARPPAALLIPGPAQAAMATRLGVAIESLRPAVPLRYYQLCPRTVVTSTRTPNSVNVTYTGLQCGQGAEAEFAANMQLGLTLAVDSPTGDLLLTPVVNAHIEQVFGVRDRGVLRNALQVRNLAGDLHIVLPVDNGVAFTRENAPAAWTTEAPISWRWPQEWQAALLIAEGEKGCLSLWADEPRLRYARLLSLCRGTEQWAAALEFETTDMNYRCDAMEGATWRLNVFAGNWLKAAERYRAQMAQQWPDLQPLEAQAPAWADTLRVVVAPALPDADSAGKLAALLPPDTTAIFALDGWQPPKEATPADLILPPAHIWTPTLKPELPARIAALEKQGFHVFPYTNHKIIPGSYAWAHPDYNALYLPTWRVWARLYPEASRDWQQHLGSSGLYEGYSWVMRRHLGEEPAEENWFTGSAGMLKYFKQLLPQTVLMGELNNEVTCRGQRLALATPPRWPAQAHPISSYLFEPYIRLWSYPSLPEGFDADDIRGMLTTWPSAWDEHPLPAPAQLRVRGQLFAREQLRSIWPEKWDPRVLHYYRGKSGTEYRLLRDQGTRLVRLSNGQEVDIYRRVSGVGEAKLPGAAIPGWPAYDHLSAIGLDSTATYIPVAGASPPPAVICALPKGFIITRCLAYDAFWVATLDPLPSSGAQPVASTPRTLCTLRVRGGETPLTFCGVESVKALPAHEYELQVQLPGAFAACWGESINFERGASLAELPGKLTIYRPHPGLESSSGKLTVKGGMLQLPGGDPAINEEGAVSWLITLPADRQYLVFRFGAGIPFGDGIDYTVRVNGNTAWQRHRDAQILTPEELQGKTPIKMKYGAVDLAAFAGKTIVLELAARGRELGAAEGITWGRPDLRDVPPKDAETDKPTETKPEMPE